MMQENDYPSLSLIRKLWINH